MPDCHWQEVKDREITGDVIPLLFITHLNSTISPELHRNLSV